jgi:hypothetical protein
VRNIEFASNGIIYKIKKIKNGVFPQLTIYPTAATLRTALDVQMMLIASVSLQKMLFASLASLLTLTGREISKRMMRKVSFLFKTI